MWGILCRLPQEHSSKPCDFLAVWSGSGLPGSARCRPEVLTPDGTWKAHTNVPVAHSTLRIDLAVNVTRAVLRWLCRFCGRGGGARSAGGSLPGPQPQSAPAHRGGAPLLMRRGRCWCCSVCPPQRWQGRQVEPGSGLEVTAEKGLGRKRRGCVLGTYECELQVGERWVMGRMYTQMVQVPRTGYTMMGSGQVAVVVAYACQRCSVPHKRRHKGIASCCWCLS